MRTAGGRDVSVADPGVAAGPLAAVLDHGRERLEDDLDDSDLAVPPAARAFVLALLAERAAPLLVVTARTSDAEALGDGLAAFLGDDRVAAFPAWETLPHERLSPQAATVGRRLAVLDRLCRPQSHAHPLLAVVAPVRAALQPMDPALSRRGPLRLDRHWDGLDRLVDGLAQLGYSRAAQVESRGQFAVRGGIVDVFPAASDHAVRVEFFGDDVESLRTFGVADQRTLEAVAQVTVDPARELVLDDELRARARDGATRMPALAEPLGKLADGVTFDGAESLVTLLHPRPALLPDFLPDGAGVAVVDPLLVRDRAAKLHEEATVLAEVAWRHAAVDGNGHAPVGFASVDDLRDRSPERRWNLAPFGPDRLPGAPWDSFRGDVDGLASRVKALLADGLRVVVTVTGHGPARRLADVLGGDGVPVLAADDAAAGPPSGRAEVVASPLRTGFVAAELGLALLGELDVFGPRRGRRRSRRLGNRRAAGDTVLDLSVGDAVVHRFHGVGVYRGMVTREIPGAFDRTATRDYVQLEYAGGDMLYVPSDQVDAIARYQGGDTPQVMRLGGNQWERAKNRVRKAVRDIAGELIRLYAARMHATGTAFEPDGMMQRELEDAFAHVETRDQLVVVDEIKRDMETPLPMDRLLTGDVGFGKTEVAVRAAAKAVFAGSQVAVLVPTTILAQQHFETFRERFAGFPVEVAMLSRFVTERDRRGILDGLAAGTLDIVIGTHGLLGKHVRWKDLGLVVVDEEQRFGVSQKERLKQLRTSVDVLSLSATPIPRTLEMAIGGIRDLSVIETPPEDRQPVVTVVAEYDDDQVLLAIRRELLRDGQVFYVHNQVDSIHAVASDLQERLPDARVAVAHGQMEERALERVMLRFWDKEVDVLVCTTIIESGLDIPNANTLVVERADLLGLSQLHQLRGRVGRSAERGYAYFLYPPAVRLTEEAYKRLETVAEHSRLGSGLSIALRDLEIRGAGNVVGAEQSGHVSAVGFDMYAQLLKEEVAELTGTPVEEEVEITIDLPVDAHLPHDYVADERQRLQLYKRVAAVRDAAGVTAVRDELVDRFGRLPEAAERLLNLAALKAALRRWGVTDVRIRSGGARGPRLVASPVRLTESQQVRLQRRHRQARLDRAADSVEVPLPEPLPDDIVAWTAATLRDVLR